ncbi:Sodium/hydrogen exchanger family-domain-containing protein [Infundibulicybe gibba]|nr:Sodium/hydrogen exchanger family-domain-containing protein [Infundibulicybe gibba]
MFAPFEVTIPHIAYACLGGFVVLFGMFSLFLREKLYIGEACWAFLFGVIIGPYGANVFNPRAWGSGSEDVTNTITLEFTRVVLAIGVFAIGVELPKAYMARHWKSLLFLLVPVMTWGWFVSAGLIFALIPGLSFLSSLAVAACLTPTDPILAAAVVGGRWADKHVPAHIRHLLAAESGCNDGAAFPFLFISLYLLLDKSTGSAIQDWFLVLWLCRFQQSFLSYFRFIIIIDQVIMGAVIGALIGFGFRHLMKFGQRHDLIDRHSYVAQYVSLAMLTIGVTTLLGSDDLLAAFTCGTAFAWDGFFNRQTEESVFSSVIDLLFNVACFVFIGAWMPFSTFDNAALTLSVWRLIVIAILVLLLRRLPAMIALYRWIPDIKTFREAVFSGHFGPIGVGAIFISTLASEYIHKHHTGDDPQIELLAQTIEPIVAFMVLCSITIHGLSIPGFSLGRRVHSVSRTWSRHAPPEWTNQARMVSRPEEIVINRDNEMERGELPPDETCQRMRSARPGRWRLGGATPYEGSIETRMGDSTVLGNRRCQKSRPSRTHP